MELSNFIPKFLSDPYDRPARLYPSLLAFLPAAVLLVCLFGSTHFLASVVLPILGFCGSGYVLGRISRDAGKRIQDKLFAKWGGAPTTQLLRFRDPTFDAHTKERFHNTLAKGLGKALPTAEAERLDPLAADELYRAATVWLIGQTRDTKKFPLVFKENVAFGFHRNSLGVRPVGIAIALICVIWVVFHAKVITSSQPYVLPERVLTLDPAAAVALGIGAIMLLILIFLLNENALKRAGFSYAERLLQSCDHLNQGTPKSTSRARKNAS